MALNQDNLESGASLVKLALANYRAQLVNLPESEHADDAQLLLRLANEDQAVVEWASALTGADSSELQKSAIYYIEHQCFGIASDFYGILALNPWATLDDLKRITVCSFVFFIRIVVLSASSWLKNIQQ